MTSRHHQQLISMAKNGGVVEQGKLFSSYTNYLKLIAQVQLDRRVRQRLSPSDIVQETLMEAHRDFASFRGETDAEFAGWLRQILIHNLMRASEKHLHANKRDVRREVRIQSLKHAVETSNSRFEFAFPDGGESPSSALHRYERMRLLADAIAELPKDQRQVIVMRHIEGLQFGDIAEQMERTSGACRMLWLRAMEQLRMRMEGYES
jgi:RNA polymerase sigma-70 factor (ECF subfamily)